MVCCLKVGERKQQVKVLLRTGAGGVLSCGEGKQQAKVLLRTGATGVLSCGEGRQQFKVLVRTGTGGVLSCGEGRQQFKVLLGLANCAGASLMHCTKLGWIGAYTFAKFASALVNFSYNFVDGNTTFNDRPLTDLKIKCVQS